MELVKGKEGWEYHSNKAKYSIYEGECIGSNFTSDIMFIMDDCDDSREPDLVGWLYGAGLLNDLYLKDMYEKEISYYVERYEAKQHMPNGIARLEHAKKIVEAYLETNKDVLFAKDADMISKDIEYLTTLIERAKEIQR